MTRPKSEADWRAEVDAERARADQAEADRNEAFSFKTRLIGQRDAERARADRAEAALALVMGAAESVSAAAASMNRAVNQASVVLDPRCRGTLGRRPDWMSPDQYDPCRCDLTTGHDGPHECEHTRADASPTEGNPG